MKVCSAAYPETVKSREAVSCRYRTSSKSAACISVSGENTKVFLSNEHQH